MNCEIFFILFFKTTSFDLPGPGPRTITMSRNHQRRVIYQSKSLPINKIPQLSFSFPTLPRQSKTSSTLFVRPLPHSSHGSTVKCLTFMIILSVPLRLLRFFSFSWKFYQNLLSYRGLWFIQCGFNFHGQAFQKLI
jgi:hypothetical protein